MRQMLMIWWFLPVSALAQEAPAGFAQRLAVTPPPDFVQGYHHGDDSRFISEYVRPGETVESWQQMITVTGLRQPDRQDVDRPALAFALTIKDGYQAACPESFSAYEQKAPEVPGAVDVFAGNLNCGKLADTGQSQAMTFVVVAGPSEIFTYQWAEQTAPWEGGSVFVAEVWDPRLHALSEGLRLCSTSDQSACVAE